MPDPRDLQRFLDGQDGLVETVRRELAEGRKRTHWMWFFFPQLAGLGRSDLARRYAIASLAEARAFLDHPILGPRLMDCASLALAAPGSAHDIFGDPDDLKFHSCLTLFASVAPAGSVFQRALETFFDGRRDALTDRILSGEESANAV
jgi:uncharacterized protein (DUF1810 family)